MWIGLMVCLQGGGLNIFYDYFTLKDIALTQDKTVIEKALDIGASKLPASMNKEDLASSIYDGFHTVTPKIARITPYKILMTLVCKEKLGYIVGLQSWQRTSKTYFDVIRNMNDGNNFPLGGSLSYNHDEDIVFFADFRPMTSMEHFSDYLELKPEFQAEIIHNTSVKKRCVSFRFMPLNSSDL